MNAQALALGLALALGTSCPPATAAEAHRAGALVQQPGAPILLVDGIVKGLSTGLSSQREIWNCLVWLGAATLAAGLGTRAPRNRRDIGVDSSATLSPNLTLGAIVGGGFLTSVAVSGLISETPDDRSPIDRSVAQAALGAEQYSPAIASAARTRAGVKRISPEPDQSSAGVNRISPGLGQTSPGMNLYGTARL